MATFMWLVSSALFFFLAFGLTSALIRSALRSSSSLDIVPLLLSAASVAMPALLSTVKVLALDMSMQVCAGRMPDTGRRSTNDKGVDILVVGVADQHQHPVTT